jgi:hypothetical protein
MPYMKEKRHRKIEKMKAHKKEIPRKFEANVNEKKELELQSSTITKATFLDWVED